MQAASQSPTTAPAAARRSTSSPAHPINAAPSQRCALHLTRRPLQHTVGKEAKGQEEKCLQVLGRTWRSSVLWQCKHLEREVTGACTPAPRRAAAARVSLACLHARRSAKGDGHLRSRRARKQQRPTAHTTNANPRTAAEHGLRRATRRACDPSVRWCWSAGVGARDDAAKPEEGNDAVGSGQRRSPRDPSLDRLSGVGAATTRKARGRQRRCWLRTAPVAGRY